MIHIEDNKEPTVTTTPEVEETKDKSEEGSPEKSDKDSQPKDYEKMWKNSSGEALKMKEQLNDLTARQKEYEAIVQTIVTDPKLLSEVQQKMGYVPPNTPSQDEPKGKVSDKVQEVTVTLQNQIAKNFRQKPREELGGKSLDDLETEDKEQSTKIIAAVGQHIIRYSNNGKDINLDQLSDVMEDGFVLAAKKLGLGKKSESETSPNELAKIGNMPSSGKKGSNPSYSSEEEKVWKGFGYDPSKIAKTKEKIISGK